MEIFHKIRYEDGKEFIDVFVNYPDEYEFGLDFNEFKKNVKNVSNSIKEYINKNFTSAKQATFTLILNGIAIGTILLAGLTVDKIMPVKDNIQTPIVENIDQGEHEYTTLIFTDANNTNISEVIQEENDEVKEQDFVELATKNEVKATNNVSKSGTTIKSEPKPVESTKPKASGITVNVKLDNGKVISIGLEDYVFGVVSAEMPVSFHLEALKAQAVAARTYALKKTSLGQILTASKSDQVYKTDSQLKSLWGNSYTVNRNKVMSAVNATAGKSITYNGKYIEALYFSTSNGKTEEPLYVWGNSQPYLKSVNSSWDVGIPSYSSKKSFSLTDLSKKLGVTLNQGSKMKITSKTSGNRVQKVVFGNKEFTGVQIRNLLGLRSADFDIKISNNMVTFECRGFGHGVGMSQYGANGMAKSGYTYTQILKHYYTGVTISN